MLIRCDRCSTLYELDEALLAPEGSPVQCTRCNHVFTARPAGASQDEAERLDATQGLDEPDRPEPPPPPLDEEEERPEPPATAFARQPAPPQRWDRPGPPVYRPSVAPPPSGVARPPQIRRDAVGAFEARLRRSARWRWLAPVLVVLALAAILTAWMLLSRRQAPVATRLRAEGLALIALDDTASLEQAAARLEEALRSAPGERQAEADRALAEVLRATALREAGEAKAAEAAARIAEQQAAHVAAGGGTTPPGGTTAAEPPPPSPETTRLQAESRDQLGQARQLSRAALETLKRLETERAAELEVARALALQHAAGGERAAVERYVAAGRTKAPDDPWLALAEATLHVRAQDQAERGRGITVLSSVVSAHPELLRARYLLAVAQADLGHRAEAQAHAEAVLAANPRHERAEALRAELERPAPAQAPPAAAAGGPGAAAGNGDASQGKPASHRPAPPVREPPPLATPGTGTASQRRVPAGTPTPTAARAGRAEAEPVAPAAPAGAAPAAGSPASPGGTAPRPGSAGQGEAAPGLAPRPLRPAAPDASPVEYGGGL